MADLRPFRALRPPAELAARVAAPPYDVVDVAEARALAAGNPESFLHVSRPEIDLPDGVDPSSDAVHAAGRAALDALTARGTLVADPAASYFVYRQSCRQGGEEHVQTGIVGCAAVADYRSAVIRTHEHTRPDKEDDRVRHIDALDAHDEPVLLFADPDEPSWTPIAEVIAEVTADPPELDVVAESPDTAGSAVRHQLWPVAAWAQTATIEAAFAKLPVLYVADGHHRSAAAARVSDLRDGRSTGSAGSQAFPVVVFPGQELRILGYHRVVADLGGLTPAGLLAAVEAEFEVAPLDPNAAAAGPARRGEFGMYCAGQWHRLTARRAGDPGQPDPADGEPAGGDPVAALDVSLLQDRVLGPLLGIGDPRTDRRIGFVGGVRGPGELERLVDAGTWAVAFALHPTSVPELVAVAAAGRVMPPKSTWFEPKLRSGLFVHPIPRQ